MPKNERTAEAQQGVSRRELAVARVLDPARARAETRVQRFLDAAFELMNTSSGREFTVQEVVERSGQSLRSFYQYFEGKYELLVALFEDSVRSSADKLREAVDRESDPLERLHTFTVEYYAMCRPSPKGKSAGSTDTNTPDTNTPDTNTEDVKTADGKSGDTKDRKPASTLAEFAQRLLTDHPQEAARAFVPLTELLTGLLDAAVAAGAIRDGLSSQRTAGVILQAIMFNAFGTTISGLPASGDATEAAEELWELLLRGMQPAARA
jgi:AcrR family transcriptional regulator